MEILQRVVAQTNSSKLARRAEKMEQTFESRKRIDLAIQSDAFAPLRSAVLPVHQLIRNLHQFITSPDLIGAKMSLFSAA